MVFIQTLALWFSNPAIAIVTTNACTKTVLHLYYNGRARRHAQGHNRSQSSMAVAKCLQCIALQHAKGRDGGKNNLSGNDKSSSLKWKVSSQRNFSQGFRGATQSLSPVRVHRKRGVVTYRNAPCLKLSVRQRKRRFSLGGVCGPVFYLPFPGFSD